MSPHQARVVVLPVPLPSARVMPTRRHSWRNHGRSSIQLKNNDIDPGKRIVHVAEAQAGERNFSRRGNCSREDCGAGAPAERVVWCHTTGTAHHWRDRQGAGCLHVSSTRPRRVHMKQSKSFGVSLRWAPTAASRGTFLRQLRPGYATAWPLRRRRNSPGKTPCVPNFSAGMPPAGLAMALKNSFYNKDILPKPGTLSGLGYLLLYGEDEDASLWHTKD